jgi:hypothetical protein
MPYYYDKVLQRYKATNVCNQSQWFDGWEEAEDFANSGGPVTEYRGFGITGDFQITKNGKFVFTAWHQRCQDLEQAKTQIDMSIMANDLMKKYPNLSKINIPDFCELENGSERQEYEENQINNHFENELYESQS